MQYKFLLKKFVLMMVSVGFVNLPYLIAVSPNTQGVVESSICSEDSTTEVKSNIIKKSSWSMPCWINKKWTAIAVALTVAAAAQLLFVFGGRSVRKGLILCNINLLRRSGFGSLLTVIRNPMCNPFVGRIPSLGLIYLEKAHDDLVSSQEEIARGVPDIGISDVEPSCFVITQKPIELEGGACSPQIASTSLEGKLIAFREKYGKLPETEVFDYGQPYEKTPGAAKLIGVPSQLKPESIARKGLFCGLLVGASKRREFRFREATSANEPLTSKLINDYEENLCRRTTLKFEGKVNSLEYQQLAGEFLKINSQLDLRVVDEHFAGSVYDPYELEVQASARPPLAAPAQGQAARRVQFQE